MRKLFASELYNQMTKDERIIFITADLGFGLFDKIREDLPDRFINTGAAEQCALGVGVGLALSGKIPVVYSITPFLLWRAAETIRNYVDHENIPVILVGSGRDDDYAHDGFSHWAGDDHRIIGLFKNITGFWPGTIDAASRCIKDLFYNPRPSYLNLKR